MRMGVSKRRMGMGDYTPRGDWLRTRRYRMCMRPMSVGASCMRQRGGISSVEHAGVVAEQKSGKHWWPRVCAVCPTQLGRSGHAGHPASQSQAWVVWLHPRPASEVDHLLKGKHLNSKHTGQAKEYRTECKW